MVNLESLVLHARQRGSDSSGFIQQMLGKYKIDPADYDISRLLKSVNFQDF